MRSLELVLVLVLALTASRSTAEKNLDKLLTNFFDVTKNEGNLFVQSMNYLFREPPTKQELTDRAVQVGVQTKWIEQQLDHFDANDNRKWQMRYMENDEYFKEGGPIFIFLGGEWSISAERITSGHLVDMAMEHNGILFYTEHRFYGESQPFKDTSVESLKYLHVKQALADVAHFINFQRQNNPGLAKSKVIIAGGSYSASMVVWFKRLYPDLVAGGWASSAPLLAKVDFKEYLEVVGRALIELSGQQCYNRVKNGVAELQAMFQQRRTAEVKAMMKICNNFDENNDFDVWTFFSSISNIFAGIIQYQSGDVIPNFCNSLLAQKDDATAIAKLLTDRVRSGCADFTYKKTLEFYLDPTFALNGARSWYYQTCNEFGWFITSGSANQPFGNKFPVTLYTTMCQDIFGDEYTNSNINAKIQQTNNDFGGMSPNVENVYQTQGSLDPWSAMGNTVADGATVIHLASHGSDLNSISSDDTAELRASRERIAHLVRQWLAE